MATETIIIDQTGNRFRSTTKTTPHARTHGVNGADPLSVQAIGGLSAKEIYQLFKRVETSCQDYTDFYKLLQGYAALGPTGKIPSALLPDVILQNSYIEYVAHFPGTIRTGIFDIIPIRYNSILAGISATAASSPAGNDNSDSNIVIEVLRSTATGYESIQTPAVPEGELATYNAKVTLYPNVPADSAFSTGMSLTLEGFEALLTGDSTIAIRVNEVGAIEPGEFLTVRVLTKLIT